MTEKVGAVLVIGGGPAGIQASLDLAEMGLKVYLLDERTTIGGNMARLDKTFPTNDCSMCILSPKLVAAGRHPNIQLIMNAEVKGITGEPGNFKVRMKRYATYVDETKCTGCGVCAEHCPIEGVNEFDMDLAPKRAIYIPFPQAVPLVFAIDPGLCIGCGECKQFCKADAIVYDYESEVESDLSVGAVLLAPGYDLVDPKVKTEYGYGKFPNVVSNLDFERILSASGPTAGHVIRPSDGDVPKRIAFIQCVGSRDAQTGNTYCSSYCCMAALKQAVIAKEHTEDLEAHIYFMDIRAFGKQFEEYVTRAEEEYGVHLHRNNRIANLVEDSNGDLILRYHEEAEIFEEKFDLVILSAGARPPREAKSLAKALGIKLNKFGFCETDGFTPLDSSAPGIFVCGAFSAPKDIPDSVAQASGAAGKIAGLLGEVKNTLVQPKEYPAEIDVSGQEPRIGVFVCHCGINIGGVVDVPAVMEYAKTLPGVAYAEQNLYTCSQDTQEKIKEVIEELKLNRVIVASCTPRTHEPLFRNTVREAGLNQYLFEMANIRDQCSWVHMKEPVKATEKAKTLVRMAVAKARLLEPLPVSKVQVEPSALVLGGGIAGMSAAIAIANGGYNVHIVEKSDRFGGHLNTIYHTLTGLDPQEVLEETRKEIEEDEKITVHLNSTLEQLSGYLGNFESKLSDGSTVKHGIIVVATGGLEYEPKEYMYGEDEMIIPQTELGRRLAKGEFDAKNVAVIQCVGSRNEEYPNCSRICCFTAMANALRIKKEHPETSVYVLYRDIRTFGFAEEYYNEAARAGVLFVRWDPESPPVVTKENGQIVIRVTEQFIEDEIVIKPDLVVLNAGVRANPDNEELAKMLKVPRTEEGYFLEAHMKLRPVDFATDGIFLCGLAHSPRLIWESIAMANAAAARAMTVLSKGEVESEGATSVVDADKCRGCGDCEEACEFGAARLVEVEPGVMKSQINEILCKGCGTCVATCCNRAITLRHFRSEQIMQMIQAALDLEGKT
ncbi:MAG TPA: CoB--CoM heterodisulfide reductase iron-sulfur subunit A family protein [Euryarchaeota archaeon]|nr:CoB--CoM heterodisulfide reductase iron-sulfur subunit A family protein [Euryarchaeota archaeon]